MVWMRRTTLQGPAVEGDDAVEDRSRKRDRDGPVRLPACASAGVRHIIGVSVSETIAEIQDGDARA